MAAPDTSVPPGAGRAAPGGTGRHRGHARHASALGGGTRVQHRRCLLVAAPGLWRPAGHPSMPTRQALSEADVLATAQREGLVLIEAPGTATGYKGVTKQATAGSCYMARAGGNHLGSFPSACEAALAYARHMKSTTCAQPAEGATEILACARVCDSQRGAALDALRTSANPFGFTGVSASGKQLKPFKATIPSSLRAADSNGYLGCFATAEDAAIAIVDRVGLDAARTPRASQTTARKSADFHVPLDAAAEGVLVAQAEAEAAAAGLTLVVNEKSASGYNCVHRRVLKRRKQEADGPPCYYYSKRLSLRNQQIEITRWTFARFPCAGQKSAG